MEPKTPMILPKGIVVNTKDIYHEVAKYGLVPADRVWEFWRVYTTTNKKLQDPTARRLENFWWHVLGSDRRFLSGETLARLYEDISLGPTFVPLRGPPNRWEGDDVPSSVRRAMAIVENEKTPTQPQSETALNETGARLRDLSSSAAKPPPPHPILKKPRGPSSSGPRPTARFVSPQPSGDEEDKDSETASSGSTVTPALEMRLPATSPPKKKVHGKRFVVATGAAKRRPVLPKKASSQISAASDNGSKARSSSSSSKGSSTPQLLGSPTLGDLPAKTPAKSSGSPKLSAKAAGKRPISVGKTSSETKDTPGQTINTTSQQDLKSVPPRRAVDKAAPSTSAEPAQNHDRLKNRPQSLLNLPSHARRSTETIRPANGDADGSIAAQHGVGSVPMAQSRSHTGYVHHRDRVSSRELEKGLFTGATASTTNVAAQGMIIDPSDSFGQLPASNDFDRYPNSSGSAAQSLSSSLHEPRLTPTKPSTSGSVPLGRTKSQLTLLLEREDEARAGRKARSKS